MKLIDDLLKSVEDADSEIRQVIIGLHWTVVLSKYAGMAHTYKIKGKTELPFSGNFKGKSALEVAKGIKSWDNLEATLGLAALNSLIKPADGVKESVNTRIMDMCGDKTITVVGRFPFNREAGLRAKKAYFLEIEPEEDELPSFASEEVIPESDIVVISATAIINKSLPRLLELSIGRKCIVLGPSTPLNDVLFDYGVDITAGVNISDPDRIACSAGEGVKSFKKLSGIEPIIRFKAD
ncbi:MAG: DUF364 domain-containing protein [Armatimonadota bacterium]